MFAAMGELKMIVHAWTSKHHSVEALMVLKPREHGQVKPYAIHAFGTDKIANGPSDSKMHLHRTGLMDMVAEASKIGLRYQASERPELARSQSVTLALNSQGHGNVVD